MCEVVDNNNQISTYKRPKVDSNKTERYLELWKEPDFE